MIEYTQQIGMVGMSHKTASVETRECFTFDTAVLESFVANAKKKLTSVDTVILFTEAKYSFISSTVARDLLRYGKDISSFLPPNVKL